MKKFVRDISKSYINHEKLTTVRVGLRLTSPAYPRTRGAGARPTARRVHLTSTRVHLTTTSVRARSVMGVPLIHGTLVRSVLNPILSYADQRYIKIKY